MPVKFSAAVPMEPVVDAASAARRFGWGLTAVLASSGVFALWVELKLGGSLSSLYFDDSATVIGALVATVSCRAAMRRHRGRTRLFWRLMCIGCASWTLGETLWLVYDVISPGNVPQPSWADAAYLGALPPVAAALLVHPVTHGRATSMSRAVVEGLVIASALLLLSWSLVFEPVARTVQLSSARGLVTFAYPLSDIVIVFLIVLVVRGTTGGGRLDVWCLLGGLLAITFSDSIYTYLTNVKSYSSGNVIDVGWFAGYLGIALGGLCSRPDSGGREQASRTELALTPTALVAPFVPMLAALCFIAIRLELHHPMDRVTRALAFALVGFVLIRQALLVIDLRASADADAGGLADRLAAAFDGLTRDPDRDSPPQPR